MTAVRRISIKQVASEAGVSAQTVSRVLNQRPDVAPETRQRVQEIIERLGFQPSALARSLIQQRSYMLGVVTAGLAYIGPSQTLNGITQQAAAMGYAVLLRELPRFDSSEIAATLQSLVSRHVDGIIWAVPEVGVNRAWLADPLHPMAVPIIFLTMQPRPDIPCVTIDNYAGACGAVQHLLDLGRRHIGHIAGPLDWWEASERKRAWEDTLRTAGLTVEERAWAQGNWSSASGERAIRALLVQYPELDAIFVANDQMALSALNVAHALGRRVPDDLAIVGFDDLPEAIYFWPPLTTVAQPLVELGRQAVRKLHDLVEAGRLGQPNNGPLSLVLTPTLVARASTIGFLSTADARRDGADP